MVLYFVCLLLYSLYKKYVDDLGAKFLCAFKETIHVFTKMFGVNFKMKLVQM